MSRLRSLTSIKTMKTFMASTCESWQVLYTPVCRQSGLPPLKKEQINTNMQLKTIQCPSNGPRPLVLLFGWMMAKQRHLDKYCNLYHSKGFDVLSLQMRPTQVLIPKRAQRTMDTLLDVLEDSSLSQRPLIHHGFSVGGYVYGEMLIKLTAEENRFAGIRNRMLGQIFDSPVDFEGVPFGFASVLTKNKQLRSVIQHSLELYLKVMKGPITQHYLKASETFHRNEMRLPTLLLYSKADPIGVAHRIEQVMEKWQKSGMDISGKCWESSPHVSHFHRHPDEYVEAVLAFLNSIGLSHPQLERVKKAQAL